MPAATVAAHLRPNPDPSTDTPPPPPPARARRHLDLADGLLAACGIDDLAALAARCAAARQAQCLPVGRWSPSGLLPAIQLAVHHRGWPPHAVPAALLAVAGDPATRSPMRLAEAGPWWEPATTTPSTNPPDLAAYEERLDAVDGLRVTLQARARQALSAEGVPLTRASVVRRACALLDERLDE
ncbi:hypothetical protein [Motilibacter deserti]|uniref:Uncharacterized protein n=1 Tax=Motilibacter deserti TaxID=2714956 RepID=A0ABX0H3V4_9ACTN|nr:hypothetical protein [Motilibacter deserti]NHC16445.1 hypothetical protein [Motilibacter deserti]